MDLLDICPACYRDEREMLADAAQKAGDYVRCERYLEEAEDLELEEHNCEN
jgi:hypothetical protein